MIRLNRVEWMLLIAQTPQRSQKHFPHTVRWLLKYGLIYPDLPVRLTPKGEESLQKAIAEHVRHGNLWVRDLK